MRLTTEEVAFYYAQGKSMIHGPGRWMDEFDDWFSYERGVESGTQEQQQAVDWLEQLEKE